MVAAREHLSCNEQEVKRGAWLPDKDGVHAPLLTSCLLQHKCSPAATIFFAFCFLEKGVQCCGKSCRLRWLNYLRLGTKRGNFNPYEVDLIIELRKRHENKWAEIFKHLPGRTGNDVMNFWNVNLKKKQKVGINDDVVGLVVPNNDLQVQAEAGLHQDHNPNWINNNLVRQQQQFHENIF